MKKGRIIALIVACLSLIVFLFVLLQPREPVYEGRPISEWIEQLTGVVGNQAGAVASHTLPKLIQQKPGKEIVPYLGGALRRGTSVKDRFYAWIHPKLPAALLKKLPVPNPNRDAQLRYRAGLILYYLGPDSGKAVTPLTRALRDENMDVRRIAAAALGNIGGDAKRAGPDLIAASGDPSADVRRAALKALAGVEDDPAIVVSVAARLLKDPDDGVRTEAAQLLKELGSKAGAAVRPLVESLSDTNDDVFRFSAMALGRIGPDAREAVPALRLALRDRGPDSETTIRWALKQIDAPGMTNTALSR